MEIVKIPTSYGGLEKTGSEKAPDMIVETLENGVWLNESEKKPVPKVSGIEFNDESSIKKIHEIISKGIKGKENSIFLGGDHSITYSTFKEFAKKNPNAGIISFDAHPDVFENFEDAVHEDWLFHLIEEGILKPEHAIIVGVRAASKEEIEYLRKKKIKYYPMKNIFGNVEGVCDAVMEMARGFGSLYVSVDIDAVDPAFAPGTGYMEPCGMTSRELLYFLQRLKLLKNLKALDIVEIIPDKDVNGMTVKLGAKILGEFL